MTIPHKEAALAVADEASEAAQEIGAANTLSFADGRIRAENTDATGLLAALPGPVEGQTALVLGAGGSARAVVWALAGQGASVSVWNRTAERARRAGPGPGVAGRGHPAEGRLAPVSGEQARAGSYELIVNCTAIGMQRRGSLRAPADRAGAARRRDRPRRPRLRGVGEPAWSRGARAAARTAIDGLEILVRQGAESLRIWTGMDPPLDVMRGAARSEGTPDAGSGVIRPC